MYCIIDIETTGGSARNERITEIAMYKHDGFKIVAEWQSLINPEKRIPYHIAGLTGITNEMVENAPYFYEVAKEIVEFTEDCVFVAHNSKFDYGFFKAEFRALGYEYERDTLCTVKLSRKLLPGKRSYSLGKLSAELGIEISARHRAAGDARATVTLFEMLLANDFEGVIGGGKASSKGEYATGLSPAVVQNLPNKIGVYYLYDAEGMLIYVGKSTKIKSRILQHLNNYETEKGVRMMEEIASIDFEICGSELISLLLESHEIKKHRPKFNRAARRNSYTYGLYEHTNDKGYRELRVKSQKGQDAPLCTYTTMTEGRRHLEWLKEEYELCPCLCGLYKSDKGCFHVSVGQCSGAQLGQESSEEYNAKVDRVLEQFAYPEPNFFILDKGRDDSEHSAVLIEEGRYKGFGYIPTDQPVELVDQLRLYITPYEDNRHTQSLILGFLRQNQKADIRYFESTP